MIRVKNFTHFYRFHNTILPSDVTTNLKPILNTAQKKSVKINGAIFMNDETDRYKRHCNNYTYVDAELSYIKRSQKYMWVPHFTCIPSLLYA
jgi:hypothetical protein